MPNKLPIVEFNMAIAWNNKTNSYFFSFSRFCFTSFPPIARTTKAAVETGDGNVPKAFILKTVNNHCVEDEETRKFYPIAS